MKITFNKLNIEPDTWLPFQIYFIGNINKGYKLYISDENAVPSLVQSPIQILTTVERNSLSLTLGSFNKGVLVSDSTLNTLFVWSGTEWISNSSQVIGGSSSGNSYFPGGW